MQDHTHPEVSLYRQHQERWPLCQQTIEQWRQSNIPLQVPEFGLYWTFAGAQDFVGELVALFQAYNDVLWAHFPYCPACGGQCCVVGASDVRIFDLLAVALLGEQPPVLSRPGTLGSRACIYLTVGDGRPRCSWPTTWRTIKCWSFYCLGSTTWPADSDVGARYRALTAALRTVVEEKLPEPLRRYEAITQLQLAAALEDPVEFAQCFHTALELILVTPLRRQFATLPCEQAQDSTSRAQPNLFLVEDEVAKFVGQAMTELDEVDGPLWEDLETLIWVVESRPADARRTLLAMSQRYATEPRSPLEAQLHRHLLQLLSIRQLASL